MTEAEWNSCTDSSAMLEFLRVSRRATERKLRLFSCACVRRVWPHLTDERGREAVRVAERFADDLAPFWQLYPAREGAWEQGLKFEAPAEMAVCLVCEVAPVNPTLTTWGAAIAAAGSVAESRLVRCTACKKGYAAMVIAQAWAEGDEGQEAKWRSHVTSVYADGNDAAQDREKEVQAGLLRCIFGPVPFRPLPALDERWLRWNDNTVKRLAESVYEERNLPDGTLDGGRLGVLVDALTEAGCSDVDLLEHLRGPGPHVMGCFAVDELLGRE